MQLGLTQAEHEIRLVLSRIDAFPQDGAVAMVFDDRVVTRRDVIAAERFRFFPEVPELELLIAHHARIRRSPGLVFAGKIIDHEPLELIGFVHDVMRKA